MKRKSVRKTFIFLIAGMFILSNGIAGIFPSAAAQESNKEEESFFVAKKAFDDGFYDVAMSLLSRFTETYPASSKIGEAHVLIGRCYFNQNKFLDALHKFEDIQSQPYAKNVKDSVLYWMAEIHFKGNNYTKAETYYKMIIDGFPKSSFLPSAYYSMGWCLFQEQKYNEALEYFRSLEDKFEGQPQAKDAALKIIECLYNLKQYSALKEKAKTYLQPLAKETEKILYLNFYVAEADFYTNNFPEAIDGYSAVIKSSGNNEKLQAIARLGLAWSYLKTKQYTPADESFKSIQETNLEKKSRDVLLLGKALLSSETGNFEESKNIYSDLISSASEPLTLVQAYLGKGDSLYNLADYKEAIVLYKEALSKSESSPVPGEITDKVHYGLAWAYLKDGEFKDAIKEFQKIVKNSDDKIVKASALCQIGDAYQDAGDYAKAQETYDTILKGYADTYYSDYVQYQLGVTMLKAANYDGAILSLQALLKNYQSSKLRDDAAFSLGLAYFQKQDYSSSKEVFQEFADHNKESNLRSQAMYLIGTNLYNLGKFPEAIDAFKIVIRDYGQDSELVQKAEYEIADCYYRMGNEDEAMNRFKSLRAKYPDSKLTAEIIWWLGEYYYGHNQPDMAKRYFSSLIQDFPGSSLMPDAYYILGSIYAEESKFDEAKDFFKKVIESSKSDISGQAATAIADIYLKQNDYDQAVKSYEEVVRNYPHLANIIYPKMAELFYKNGNYEDALRYYTRSLDVVPLREMAEIQFKIAETLQSQGKAQEAVEAYLKVSYMYSDSEYKVKSLLRVGQIYEDKHDPREAVNIYQKITEMNIPESKFARERIEALKSNIK